MFLGLGRVDSSREKGYSSRRFSSSALVHVSMYTSSSVRMGCGLEDGDGEEKKSKYIGGFQLGFLEFECSEMANSFWFGWILNLVRMTLAWAIPSLQ